jgi:hypothetical protein
MVTNCTSSLVTYLTAIPCTCALEAQILHCIEDDMNVEVSCAACTELSKTAMKLHYHFRIGKCCRQLHINGCPGYLNITIFEPNVEF